MNLEENTEKVIEYVKIINRKIHIKHHEMAQRNNLTLEQFHLMVHLDNNNPPTIGEIARRSDRAQNTISERVSRLEEKELLVREKDPHDRRVSRVMMTNRGKELMHSIKKSVANEFVYHALLKMGDSDVNDLVLNMEKLIQNME